MKMYYEEAGPGRGPSGNNAVLTTAAGTCRWRMGKGDWSTAGISPVSTREFSVPGIEPFNSDEQASTRDILCISTLVNIATASDPIQDITTGTGNARAARSSPIAVSLHTYYLLVNFEWLTMKLWYVDSPAVMQRTPSLTCSNWHRRQSQLKAMRTKVNAYNWRCAFFLQIYDVAYTAG